MKTFLLIATLAAGLLAQRQLSFEVASVKLLPPSELITMIGAEPSGSRLTITAMSLGDLVSWAYNVKPWQVAGGPAWVGIQKDRTQLADKTARFNIAAKAPGDAERSVDDYRLMTQALLADRFHLAFHRENRVMPVYLLELNAKEPRFHESAPDASGILRMNGGGKITGSGATMLQLVNWFSKADGVDRPILDRTGLTGHYDFTLEWSPLRAGSDQTSSVPDIFTAFKEQLGLKLVPQNAPVEVVVIDQAGMPGAN